MNPIDDFKKEVAENIRQLGEDKDVQALSRIWLRETNQHKYSYNFSWLGRPIIQYPQDIVAMQELIWSIKPDLIIETGIAHGGSLIFSASMLALLDMCDAIENGSSFNPIESNRKVLGVDIDIRSHNLAAIEAHSMASRIQMIQGSSIAPQIIAQVYAIAANHTCVLVCLDSNHTHENVFAELEDYTPLTTIESYFAVLDKIIKDLSVEMFSNRPWGIGNNPKTAVRELLKTNTQF